MTQQHLKFPSPRGVELHKPGEYECLYDASSASRFRPLAGLSCINLAWLLPVGQIAALVGFRPLAGLSCINLGSIFAFCVAWLAVKFPSPRGVELHKPLRPGRPRQLGRLRFPSPRGVELHKPQRRLVL